MKRLLTLLFAASLAALALAPATLASSTSSGAVYWDRASCLGTAASDASGTVTFTRDGKWLGGSLTLDGVDDGTYRMLVFFTNSGTCPQGKGVFGGQISVSGGAGSASLANIKIPGHRDGNDITVVLGVGGNTSAPGRHFSVPVTLGP